MPPSQASCNSPQTYMQSVPALRRHAFVASSVLLSELQRNLLALAGIMFQQLTVVQRYLGNVTPLSRNLPPDVDGQSLKKASCPHEDLSEVWSNADLVALSANKSPVDLPFWFVPSATAPQAGQAVTVLGHGGAPLSAVFPTSDYKAWALCKFEAGLIGLGFCTGNLIVISRYA